MNAAIAGMNRDFSGSPINREPFLDRIDGITFGDDPRHGFFKGRVFHHPEMAFRVDFPEGWKTTNARQAVTGSSEPKDAVVQLTLAEESTAADGLRAFFAEEGIQRAGSWSPANARGGEFIATLQQGEIRGRVVFVEHDGHVFRLLGFAKTSSWSSHVRRLTETLTSFRRETDRRVLAVQPARLRLIRVDSAMTVDRFAERYDATIDPGTLAAINGLEQGGRLAAGRSYKVVQGGNLP